MTPTPHQSDELDNLTYTPCVRCYACNFKPDGDCMNPYKECSVCSVIRQLAKDYEALIEHEKQQLLERVNSLQTYRLTEGHPDILVKRDDVLASFTKRN